MNITNKKELTQKAISEALTNLCFLAICQETDARNAKMVMLEDQNVINHYWTAINLYSEWLDTFFTDNDFATRKEISVDTLNMIIDEVENSGIYL